MSRDKMLTSLLTYVSDNCREPLVPIGYETETGVIFLSENYAFMANAIYFAVEEYLDGGGKKINHVNMTLEDFQLLLSKLCKQYLEN